VEQSDREGEMGLVDLIEEEGKKKETPEVKVGDTIRVYLKVKEGGKERVQPFEGIVIRKRGGGINQSFTVRRVSQGIGVERTYLIHSPRISKIKKIREGDVRRAKLYYLRGKVGKAAKVKRKAEPRREGGSRK